jgi:hypothetical protein
VKRRAPFRFAIGRKVLGTLAVLNLCATVCAPLRGQELLGKYEAQYQAETDPVQKAKILAKLGPLKIDQARKRLDADQDEQSLALLEGYRDNVRRAVAALASSGIDPEKHPAGFKELHIGLRETLRRLDDFVVDVPVDKRPWFRAVRADLLDLQNSLLDALFPAMAPRAAKKGKPQ